MHTTVVHTNETPRQEFGWGATAWSIGRAAGNSERLTLGRVIIEPRQANPAHCHHTCDEILYLLSGELVHYADDTEPLPMRPGDAITIPAGVFHHATCVSEERAEMVVIYSCAERDIELAE